LPFELLQINRSPINQNAEAIDLNDFNDDYRELLDGLQESRPPKRSPSSNNNANASASPSNAAAQNLSDPFGDQLEEELQTQKQGGQTGSNNSSPGDQKPIFMLDDEMMDSDKSLSPINSKLSPE